MAYFVNFWWYHTRPGKGIVFKISRGMSARAGRYRVAASNDQVSYRGSPGTVLGCEGK